MIKKEQLALEDKKAKLKLLINKLNVSSIDKAIEEKSYYFRIRKAHEVIKREI